MNIPESNAWQTTEHGRTRARELLAQLRVCAFADLIARSEAIRADLSSIDVSIETTTAINKLIYRLLSEHDRATGAADPDIFNSK